MATLYDSVYSGVTDPNFLVAFPNVDTITGSEGYPQMAERMTHEELSQVTRNLYETGNALSGVGVGAELVGAAASSVGSYLTYKEMMSPRGIAGTVLDIYDSNPEVFGASRQGDPIATERAVKAKGYGVYWRPEGEVQELTRPGNRATLVNGSVIEIERGLTAEKTSSELGHEFGAGEIMKAFNVPKSGIPRLDEKATTHWLDALRLNRPGFRQALYGETPQWPGGRR